MFQSVLHEMFKDRNYKHIEDHKQNDSCGIGISHELLNNEKFLNRIKSHKTWISHTP